MRAARIDSYGGPEMLRLMDVVPPVPGPGQVLVEVHGSSINPADFAVLSGWMQEYVPLQLPQTLGSDVAGIVLAVGRGVATWRPATPYTV